MSQMMMYVFPLILGRSFDLNTLKVGPDIFPEHEIKNFINVQNPITETTYRLVGSNQETRKLLDVSGAFSLNVKSGLIKAGASGQYMTDAYNRENTVEIVIKANYETVTERLSPNAQPKAHWKLTSGIGTHYVRSIVYGGELIASIRLLCNDTRDKMKVKAALEGGGRIKIFDVGASVEGEYMSDVFKSVEKVEIKVHSTLAHPKVVHDVQRLNEMLDTFPEIMKNYNYGRGVPLKVELCPLGQLDPSRPLHLKNTILDSDLEMFEEKFDDLLNTKAAMEDWMKSQTSSFSDDQETKIGQFHGRLSAVLNAFRKTTGDLDMSKDSTQLEPALTLYGDSIPGSYYRQYARLRQEMMDDIVDWFPNKGVGGTYTHYGSDKCGEKAETLYTGFTSIFSTYEGSSQPLCLSKRGGTSGNESTNEEENDFKNMAGSLNDFRNLAGHASNLENLTGSMTHTFHRDNDMQIQCAFCRMARKKSVLQFVGVFQCPKGWDLVYRGHLTANTGKIHSNIFCLEEQPPSVEKETTYFLSNAKDMRLKLIDELMQDPSVHVTPCAICSK